VKVKWSYRRELSESWKGYLFSATVDFELLIASGDLLLGRKLFRVKVLWSVKAGKVATVIYN
jgi:hypothetical protein